MIYQDYACNLAMKALSDPASPQFVGLECEIERLESHGDAESLGWNVTTDGSLRNNGFEFISKPVPVAKASEMFQGLHGTIKLIGDDPFSQRTSIHVHANCANLTAQVTRNIVLMYALYEEAFFLLCSPERRDNIHCTPLTETYLPTIYSCSLSTMISRWHKYTALNIKPLSTQGTIEFRHMHGHDDTELLDEWLTVISNLITVSKDTQVNAELLKEDKMLTTFTRIFGQSRLCDDYALVRSMMTNQIIDVKLVVM